jgi:Co/Zn/Cd efflux system component
VGFRLAIISKTINSIIQSEEITLGWLTLGMSTASIILNIISVILAKMSYHGKEMKTLIFCLANDTTTAFVTLLLSIISVTKTTDYNRLDPILSLFLNFIIVVYSVHVMYSIFKAKDLVHYIELKKTDPNCTLESTLKEHNCTELGREANSHNESIELPVKQMEVDA